MPISRQQLPKTTDKKRGKISKVMREFKNKKLKNGQSNKKVKNRKQDVAIDRSEAGGKKKQRRRSCSKQEKKKQRVI